MKKKLVVALFLFSTAIASAQTFTLASPDKKITVTIDAGDRLTYRVQRAGNAVLERSALSLTLTNGTTLGRTGKPASTTQQSVAKTVKPLFGTAATYKDEYNNLLLKFKDYTVEFRAYNNGVAYRFATTMPSEVTVTDEEVEYAFPSGAKAWAMHVPDFLNSYEEHYTEGPLSQLDSGRKAVLPLVVQSGSVKVGITESDLLDYAGLYLTHGQSNTLRGLFPKFVTKDSVGGCCPNFERVPVERADYIAKTRGSRTFPWRLMILADSDKELLHNNLVYLLASEPKDANWAWVKPGLVAWDWWNAVGLTGVPFQTGYNTETYKYFIDFAARNGIRYINMDEGWSDQFDLLKVNDGSVKIGTNPSMGGGLDMPYLFNYAKQKGVGIFLWVVWHTLDRQLPEAMDQFQRWGVAGLKIDFMDRDDQTVVNFYERIAAEAAKRRILINYHGAYKPTGLERTYPNVINREAVQGLEYNKFSDKATPEHAAHIPFLRGLAGPMDYTPGGLTNAAKADFRIVQARPMTQGTRCQQLAQYIVYYAPLAMLSDAPTAYEKEPVMLNYLKALPTTWDETKPIDGAIGDYAVVARRKGDVWYIGGLTDWSERTLNLSLNFLPAGRYTAQIFKDGPNAHRIGNDYATETRTVSSTDALDVLLKPGGGFVVKLTPTAAQRSSSSK